MLKIDFLNQIINYKMHNHSPCIYPEKQIKKKEILNELNKDSYLFKLKSNISDIPYLEKPKEIKNNEILNELNKDSYLFKLKSKISNKSK